MRVSGFSHHSSLDMATGRAGRGPMIDEILKPENAQIDAAKVRRESLSTKKNDFGSLDSLLGKLQSTADQLKLPSGFQKFTVDSSDPDVLTGDVVGPVELGSYSLEVSTMPRAPKSLSFGFPDKDSTPVGFGFMQIATSDGTHDIVVEPNETLRDVAARINDSVSGVRASIINTGTKTDPFRLLVSAKESGEDIQVNIDPDTTFLEFKDQIVGQDLTGKFEGVAFKRNGNKLDELIDGLSLRAAKASPGQEITLNVKHDFDKTASSIKDFVNQYNSVHQFSRGQATSPEAGVVANALSGESSVRQVNRSLQSAVMSSNLVDVGISTNAKTGELILDESKLKDALAKNYDGVMGIFATTESGPGLASRLSDAIKAMKDKSSGAVGSRLKGLDQRIRTQDLEIQKKEQRLSERKASLEKSLGNLDARIAGMETQGQFLAARFNSNAG